MITIISKSTKTKPFSYLELGGGGNIPVDAAFVRFASSAFSLSYALR